MRRFHILCATTALCAATSVRAQACPAGEDVLWSCETRSKTYALCASKDAARDRGHVQYRVMQGQRVEFVFPERPRPPAGLFLYQLFNKSAQVSFANGAYAYDLREAMEAPGEIEVTRDGRRVALVKCRTSSDTLTLTPTIRRFEALGMTR